MKCKKCGAELPENANFCQDCGNTVSGAKKAKNFFIGLIIAVIIIAALFVAFLFGNFFSKTDSGKSFQTPNIIESIAEKIQNITAFPITVEFTENELNKLISENKSSLVSFEEITVEFTSTGGLEISGVIPLDEIKDDISSYVPDFLLMFLSDDIPFYAEAYPTVADGEIYANISTFTVSGISLSQDALELIGIDDIIRETLKSAIMAEYDGKAEITSIEIGKSQTKNSTVLKIGFKYYPAGKPSDNQ